MAKNQEDWEFGRPPEEIGVSEEISFPDPALEFSAPPPEYTDPAPEIIEPDSAPAESGTHGKQASSRFYMMLLTVVLALMAGWTAQPLDAAARKQNRGHAIEEGLVVTETTYRKKENSEQGGESSVSGEGAESSGSDRSESGEDKRVSRRIDEEVGVKFKFFFCCELQGCDALDLSVVSVRILFQLFCSHFRNMGVEIQVKPFLKGRLLPENTVKDHPACLRIAMLVFQQDLFQNAGFPGIGPAAVMIRSADMHADLRARIAAKHGPVMNQCYPGAFSG